MSSEKPSKKPAGHCPVSLPWPLKDAQQQFKLFPAPERAQNWLMGMERGMQSGPAKLHDHRAESCFCSEDKLRVGLTYPEVSSSSCLKFTEMLVFRPIQSNHNAFLLLGVNVRGQCDFLLWPSDFSLGSLHHLSLPQPLFQAQSIYTSSEYWPHVYMTRPLC